MVNKILSFLYRETGSLNQAALLLGFFAFLSQVLAFLRDRLLAHIFGVGEALDIYYAAFRIPDLIFVIVASVVSISVLIPFIIEEESKGREALKEFVNNIFSFFSLLIVIVSLVAYLLMPALSVTLFKGFSSSQLHEVVFVSRLLLLSPIFLGLSNLFGSLTQAYNRFAIYALTPVIYNVGIIAGIVFFTERFGIIGVVIGVLIGASLHALIQVPFVISLGLFPKFALRLNWRSISRVVTISLPRTLTLSMSHLGLIAIIAMASLMPEGSISLVSFSSNLQSVPLSIIGVSYSLAAFPTLSRKFKENNLKAFKTQIATSIRFIIFWSIPITVLFIMLRAQIVRVLLGSGLFDWNDTRLTAALLAIFVVSSMFQSLSLLFVRGFYSAGFTRKPFFINLISTIVLIFSSWWLVKLFYLSPSFRHFSSSLLKVGDLDGTVVLMLALGFSLAAVINTTLYWFSFGKEFKDFSKGVARTFFDSLSASIIMGAITFFGLRVFALVFETTTFAGIFMQGLLSGLVAISAGILVLVVLKNKELLEVWYAFRDRFWKTKVLSTDQEIV